MFEMTVNGKRVTAERDEKLLTFLRVELELTSVKNGCSEGSCGTCTIVVDGKALRACTLTTSRAAGKNIVTCEGLSQRERQVYGYAFARVGAVQCGFCTPGMVMSAKALLDSDLSPAPDKVKAALRGNICRCTGYKKIIDAVLMAAEIFRGDLPLPENEDSGFLGDSMLRVDARAKALGEAEYVDDIRIPGMIYGSAVRSRYPRARVLSIYLTEALKVPGVVCILTAEDIPGKKKIGHIKKDYDVMIPVGHNPFQGGRCCPCGSRDPGGPGAGQIPCQGGI